MILLSQPGSTDHLALTADSMDGLAITTGSTDDFELTMVNRMALLSQRGSTDSLALILVPQIILLSKQFDSTCDLLLYYLIPRESCSHNLTSRSE